MTCVEWVGASSLVECLVFITFANKYFHVPPTRLYHHHQRAPCHSSMRPFQKVGTPIPRIDIPADKHDEMKA